MVFRDQGLGDGVNSRQCSNTAVGDGRAPNFRSTLLSMFNNSSHIQVDNSVLNAVRGDLYNIQYNVAGKGQSSSYSGCPNLDVHFLDDHRPQELANWISQLNFNEQQDAAFGRRTKGTGIWLLQSPEFTDWVGGKSRVLWCPGKRMFPSVPAH